jgi:hypothetical protein
VQNSQRSPIDGGDAFDPLVFVHVSTAAEAACSRRIMSSCLPVFSDVGIEANKPRLSMVYIHTYGPRRSKADCNDDRHGSRTLQVYSRAGRSTEKDDDDEDLSARGLSQCSLLDQHMVSQKMPARVMLSLCFRAFLVDRRHSSNAAITSQSVISLTSQAQHSNLHILATTPCLIEPERRVNSLTKRRREEIGQS